MSVRACMLEPIEWRESPRLIFSLMLKVMWCYAASWQLRAYEPALFRLSHADQKVRFYQQVLVILNKASPPESETSS
jgi:hypothetical protein